MRDPHFVAVALAILFFAQCSDVGEAKKVKTPTDSLSMQQSASESYSLTSSRPSPSSRRSLSDSLSMTRSFSAPKSLTKTASRSSSETLSVRRSISFSISPAKTHTVRSSTLTRSPSKSFSQLSSTLSFSQTKTHTSTSTTSQSQTLSKSPTVGSSTLSRSMSSEPTTTRSPSSDASATRTQFTSPVVSHSTLTKSATAEIASASHTLSNMQSVSRTPTSTITPPPTPSATKSMSATKLVSSSITVSPSPSEETGSVKPSISKSPTTTVSETSTSSFSWQASLTVSRRTPSPSKSLTQTTSTSLSMSVSETETQSESSQPSDTLTLLPTKTLSYSASSTYSESATLSWMPSISLSASLYPTTTATSSRSPSQTNSRSETISASTTASSSPTEEFSSTSSLSSSATSTVSRSSSPSSTQEHSVTETVSTSSTFTETLTMGSHSREATSTVALTASRDTLTPTSSLSAILSLTASQSTSNSLTTTSSESSSTSLSASMSSIQTRSTSVTTSSTLSLVKSASFSISGTRSSSPSVSETPSSSLSLSVTLTPSPTASGTVTAALSQSTSESESSSATSQISQSETLSGTVSFTFSDEWTETRTVSQTRSPTPSYTDTTTVTLTQTDSRSLLTFSIPLTTSPMPPTTTPVPTPTFTLPTHCPTNCVNGVCQRASIFVDQQVYYCNCYGSTSTGYWAGSEFGGPCDRCAKGYYGLMCVTVCPGGACSVCYGHGACNDGLYGDGTCSCYNNTIYGFWTGASCNSCKTGYYGSSCKSKCTCDTSHGTCSEGVTGDGTCTCSAGWKGPTCSLCDSTVNALCDSLKTCPGADNNCTGHGTCDFTLSNAGVCDCFPYYATTDCSVMCPNKCSGHGSCSDGRQGTGVCSCTLYYQAPSCSSCIYGHYNSSSGCRGICPGGEMNPCSRSGTCSDAGICTCWGIKGGVDCSILCPVASWNASLVCAGHGKCNTLGTCTCEQSATFGYWSGTSCEYCDDLHGGSSCTIACPMSSTSGGVCNSLLGWGTCNKTTGSCSCVSTKCGRACDVDTTASGACPKCPLSNSTVTYYGYDCSGICQCVNGACSDGLAGDGTCSCAFGWSGTYCNVTCPGPDVAHPCSLHGDCIQSSSSCKCDSGYAGSWCNVSCPRSSSGDICYGGGVCDDGVAGSGNCTCYSGRVWPETGCSSMCNCNGHGTCNYPVAKCMCLERYNGTNCETCIEGFHGSSCTQSCVNGNVVGYNCSCFNGYGGANCTVKCPTGSDGSICNNQGSCSSSTGTCVCNTSWVGPACTCTDSVCKSNNIFTRCDSTTGSCVCVATRTGTNCDSCITGYYGAAVDGVSCTTVCDCNGNGPCDMTTGVCSCYSDATNGFWTGGTCGQCLTGYMGQKCTQLSNAITQAADLARRTDTSGILRATYLDSDNRMLYVASSKFTGRFTVTSAVVASPETNTLEKSVNGDYIYGDIVAIQTYESNRSELIFVLQKNDSAVIDPQLFSAAKTPFLTGVTSISSNALASKTGEIASTLQFVVIRQDLNIVCGIPTAIVVMVRCKPIGPNDGSGVVRASSEIAMTLRSVISSESRNLMILAGRVSSSTCTLIGVSFQATLVDLAIPIASYLSSVNFTCTVVNAITEANGILFFSAQSTSSTFLGGYNLTNGSFIVGQNVGGTTQCTALAFSKRNNVGFSVAGSQVLKFEIVSSAGVSSINAYGQLYTTSTLISSLVIDEYLMVMYAPLSSALGLQVLRFSMVEVRSVSPTYADRTGGALITLTGKGFRNTTSAKCVFDSVAQDIYQFVDENTIICMAPQKVSSEICLTQSLEVNMNGIVTTNGFLVTRPSGVTILDVSPSYIRVGEVNRIVTITGRSFSYSPFALCRFVDPKDGHLLITAANFSTSSFAYQCTAPTTNVPWSSQSFVQISLDGFVYSTSTFPFLLIGEATGFEFGSSFTTVSSRTSYLSPVPTIYVVDTNNNRLLTVDNETRSAVMVPPLVSNINWTVANQNVTTVNGQANFSQFFAVNPTVGSFVFTVRVGLWASNFTLTVTPGAVASIIVKTQPQASAADIITPGSSLPRQVEISALDDGGNDAASAAGLRATARLVPLSASTGRLLFNGSAVISSFLFTSSGSANAGSLVITPVFGIPYVLYFALDSNSDINVSSNVFYASCPSTQYYVNGTTECLDCENDFYYCNGTDNIVPKLGAWRSISAASAFYSCPIAAACLDGGGCATGYEGPLCAVCSASYGKGLTGECSLCPSMKISVVIFVAMALFQVIFILAMIIAVTQNWNSIQALFTQSVVSIIIIIGHLQVVALLRYVDLSWTPSLDHVLAVIGIVFAFEIDRIQAVDCILRANGIDAVWFAVIYSLIVITLIPLLAAVAMVLMKQFPTLLLTKTSAKIRADLHESVTELQRVKLIKQLKNEDGSLYIKEHRRKTVLLNSTQVVVTFCFQTSCKSALQLFRCTPVVISSTVTRNYLIADYSVNCDSDNYQTVMGYSSFLVFIYIVFIPLLFIFGPAYSRKRHAEMDFRMYTSFTTLGVKDLTFFWNGLMFFRRALLVGVGVFLKAPLQGWTAAWVLMAGAWLEHYTEPWIKTKHMKTERFGFLILVVFANVALVLQRISNPKSVAAIEILLMLLLASLMTLAAVMIFYIPARELQTRIKKKRRRDEDDVEIGLADVMAAQAGNVGNVLRGMMSQVKSKAATAIDDGFSVMPMRHIGNLVANVTNAVSAIKSSNEPSSPTSTSVGYQPPDELHQAPPVSSLSDQRTRLQSSKSLVAPPSRKSSVRQPSHSGSFEIEGAEEAFSESGGSTNSDETAVSRKHATAIKPPVRSMRLILHRNAAPPDDSVEAPYWERQAVAPFATASLHSAQSDRFSVDPTSEQRMKLEQEIDAFVLSKGYGIYQQNSAANQLFDSREALTPALRRPQLVDEMMRREQERRGNRRGASTFGSDSDDSDQRSVDSDL